jgi:hypothetical protein
MVGIYTEYCKLLLLMPRRGFMGNRGNSETLRGDLAYHGLHHCRHVRLARKRCLIRKQELSPSSPSHERMAPQKGPEDPVTVRPILSGTVRWGVVTTRLSLRPGQ